MNKDFKNILVCTGIYPPDIGGSAEYARNIVRELESGGRRVPVMSYVLEKNMPSGIRQIYYFFKILPAAAKSDLIIALDTFSAGLPAVLAAKILRKKIIVRAGGDFLWENYIEAGGAPVSIRDFYAKKANLSAKQRLIFKLSKWLFNNCSAVVFSTDWQKKITEENYGVSNKNMYVVENFYGNKAESYKPAEKNFIFAGRLIKLKNLERLKAAFEDARRINPALKLEILSGLPHEKLMERIQRCYAVILPSLSDVSPNFILDAVSAGKPFIMTKETGLLGKLKEIGLFIDPFSEDDIKNKILFLADDKNYSVFKNKIADFKFTHSWREIAGEFLAIAAKL